MDLSPIWLTLRLAAVSTVVILLLGIPLAWWLSCTSSRFKTAIEAVIAMPLVLPPTVLGFYLLRCLGPHGAICGTWQWLFGYSLAFSFTGLVFGSVLYSLPFFVQPILNAFESMWPRPLIVSPPCP